MKNGLYNAIIWQSFFWKSMLVYLEWIFSFATFSFGARHVNSLSSSSWFLTMKAFYGSSVFCRKLCICFPLGALESHLTCRAFQLVPCLYMTSSCVSFFFCGVFYPDRNLMTDWMHSKNCKEPQLWDTVLCFLVSQSTWVTTGNWARYHISSV